MSALAKQSSTVGIDNLYPYLPKNMFMLQRLVEIRGSQDTVLGKTLEDAVATTGQQAIRLPKIWEDTVTMGVNAILRLLKRSNRVMSSLRYLFAGTETGMDNSKALSAYIVGVLKQAGVDIPITHSNAQVQHACAGGTIAMLTACALLLLGSPAECGLVVCSDIAHYDAPSSAEVTQGAGSIAVLVSQNPRLLTIDVGSVGYASEDVDDFFRPLGSLQAKVRGSFSVHCYHKSLNIAFLDHCARTDVAPADALAQTDYIALHTPFPSMATKAVRRLVGKHLPDSSAEQIEQYVESRGVLSALTPLKKIGNVYTGSVFLMLFFLLGQQYRNIGKKIIGKKILIVSYGSGYTMTVYSAQIAPDAPNIIEQWNMASIMDDVEATTFDQYVRWHRTPYALQHKDLLNQLEQPVAGECHLASIRKDGYREYAIR